MDEQLWNKCVEYHGHHCPGFATHDLESHFFNTALEQDALRVHTRKATTVICLATQLHTIAPAI